MDEKKLFNKRVKRLYEYANDGATWSPSQDIYNSFTIDGRVYEIHYYCGAIVGVYQRITRWKYRPITEDNLPPYIEIMARCASVPIRLVDYDAFLSRDENGFVDVINNY